MQALKTAALEWIRGSGSGRHDLENGLEPFVDQAISLIELKELTGSPKQVAWAEQIRLERMARKHIPQLADKLWKNRGVEKALRYAKEWAEQTAASWYIENRE